VVELSWYGDRKVALPLGGAFHSRRLTVRGSQVGTVSPARADRTYATGSPWPSTCSPTLPWTP
jgi:hypothetical protein